MLNFQAPGNTWHPASSLEHLVSCFWFTKKERSPTSTFENGFYSEAMEITRVRNNVAIFQGEAQTLFNVSLTIAVVPATPNLGQNKTKTLYYAHIFCGSGVQKGTACLYYNVWALLGTLEASGLLDLKRWDSSQGSGLMCLVVNVGRWLGSPLGRLAGAPTQGSPVYLLRLQFRVPGF